MTGPTRPAQQRWSSVTAANPLAFLARWETTTVA